MLLIDSHVYELIMNRDKQLVLDEIFNNDNYADSSLWFFNLGNGFGDEREITDTDIPCLEKEFEALDFDELIAWYFHFFSYYNETSSHLMGVVDKHISFDTSGSIYAGGAHPSHIAWLRTFDRYTGDEVFLKDIFQPSVVDSIYNYAREHYDSLDFDDVCAESLTKEELEGDYEGSYEMSFALVEEGMYVSPSFPHVLSVCHDNIFIPNEELGQYFKSKNDKTLSDIFTRDILNVIYIKAEEEHFANNTGECLSSIFEYESEEEIFYHVNIHGENKYDLRLDSEGLSLLQGKQLGDDQYHCNTEIFIPNEELEQYLK